MLLFAESIASAFDLYLVGRLLVTAPECDFITTQVPIMAECAETAGVPAAAFEALMQEVSREPERAFEDMRALLLDVVTALLPCADAAHAEAALDGFAGHRFEPLLHHFQLSNWILYMRAHAGPPSPADAAVAALDATLRAAPIALDWLADHWLAPDEAVRCRVRCRRLRDDVRALAMAILLDVQQLTASFGARPLFQGISFTVDEKERIGLIGPNGAGKSTLLRILAETPRPPTTGRSRGAAACASALLEQTPRFAAGVTVRDALLEGIGAGADDHEAHEQLRRVLATLALDSGGAGPRHAGRVAFGRVEEARRRSAARWPASPDLLLLDEPTNHLDVESIEWLEALLSGRGARSPPSRSRTIGCSCSGSRRASSSWIGATRAACSASRATTPPTSA